MKKRKLCARSRQISFGHGHVHQQRVSSFGKCLFSTRENLEPRGSWTFVSVPRDADGSVPVVTTRYSRSVKIIPDTRYALRGYPWILLSLLFGETRKKRKGKKRKKKPTNRGCVHGAAVPPWDRNIRVSLICRSTQCFFCFRIV